MIRLAFEEKQPEESWERDCYAMSAAQWILWYGQSLFKMILYSQFEEEDAMAVNGGAWRLGSHYEGPQLVVRSVERWRFWKGRFDAIESDTQASDECRKLASKAAGLMEAIQRALLFES